MMRMMGLVLIVMMKGLLCKGTALGLVLPPSLPMVFCKN